MNSRANARFWKAFSELPSEAKDRVREAYRLFAADPRHPSLRVKKVHETLPIYSAESIVLIERSASARAM